MSAGLPQPLPNADSEHYWAEARRGKLVLRECTDCRARHFPPRFLCPCCWSQHLRWIEASGEGRVYSFTIMQRPPAAQWLSSVPYVVALIDLAEGPRMMANISGDDALGVALDEPVRLCFEERGEARLPQFRRFGRQAPS